MVCQCPYKDVIAWQFGLMKVFIGLKIRLQRTTSTTTNKCETLTRRNLSVDSDHQGRPLDMPSEGCINSAAHIGNNNSVIEGDAQNNTILAHTGMPFYCVCLNCALCVLPSAPVKHYCLCLVKEIQNTDLRNIYMSLTTFHQPFSVFFVKHLINLWQTG